MSKEKNPPYLDTKIKDAKVKDMNVRLLGLIVSIKEKSFKLDDGSGSIMCRIPTRKNNPYFNDAVEKMIKEKNLVRVAGKVVQKNDSFYFINSLYMQDKSNLNREAYQKLLSLMGNKTEEKN